MHCEVFQTMMEFQEREDSTGELEPMELQDDEHDFAVFCDAILW